VNIKVLLWLDVEDYATVESDDAFAELLRMLEDTGARSTIKFCAKKLEVLRERGRTDILSRLSHHEMSFHTTNHSVHPLASEYLDCYGFREGAREFERREEEGFRLITEISGQAQTSYGQPGEAWAPQVFPVLRKWGINTYLDAHPILGIDGGPFWYGGVLCLTDLTNLIRLQHNDGGLEQYKSDFDNINTACRETVFVSTYDHPTEFSCSVFWDEVNFSKGLNPDILRPAPLRKPGEQTKYIEMLREFILYSQKRDNVEYITASQTPALEISGKGPILASDLTSYAAGFDNGVSYAKIKDRYLCASELFALASRCLSGRMLMPELFYGPEEDEASIVVEDSVSIAELAEAAFLQFDTVFGYKQLKSLYKVGKNLLSPVDMLCTMFAAIREGGKTVRVQSGTLKAAAHVRDSYKFGGGWVLWKDDFEGKNIFRHTRLQTWTLKPAVY
jgi:hypothetical protein